MIVRTLALLGVVLLATTGCLPNKRDIREAQAVAALYQPTALTCQREDRCAIASPLREQAVATQREATEAAPRHKVLIIDYGQDALLARIHMIRAAQQSIELQSYIFAQDDAGNLVLDELLQAAQRGVQVRVLLDQLFSLENLKLLLQLSRAHANFELRLYNPTFGDAKTNEAEFVAGILCCFSRINQRMHNKLLRVDGLLAITGGRNIQNRYFDWDPTFNYRDRDILVAGPAVVSMGESFDAFWRHPLSVPVAALRDVRAFGETHDALEAVPRLATLSRGARMLDISAQADSASLIRRQLVTPMLDVGRVDFLSDLPNKPFERNSATERNLGLTLRNLLASAHDNVLLQTPYLVLSRAARDQFREMHQRPDAPTVIVSTNSLAATDAIPVYALSHKYKRRYIRELGFRIYEFKPFPLSAPIDLDASVGLDPGALGAFATESRRAFGSSSRRPQRGPLPLREAGVRISLHAKSLVIDERVALVGTHNFDPRSDQLNTESLVLVYDREFARALTASIQRDTQPENAWTIARRPRVPVLSGLNYQLAKLSERLPLFDIWPWRYATSWELKPGCSPMASNAPGFRDCYTPVGDFPEVDFSTKALYTRIITAFGAGLAPIL